MLYIYLIYILYICSYCQQRVLNTFPLLQGWGSLAVAFTGKFVYILAHHFILL